MAQSLSNVPLHIIFSTKNRSPFIDAIIEAELYAYMVSISVRNGGFVHKIGGMPDHIHILVTLPRTVAMSDFIAEIKKSSSKWVKTKGRDYELFSWQRGYAAFAVSESIIHRAVKYIENQKEHHKSRTFQDEYRKFLHLNKIPYDEKYVWD